MKNKTLLISLISLLAITGAQAQNYAPDNTFGVSGKFSRAASGAPLNIYGTRGQTDGKIIACGCWATSGVCDSAVAFRLKTNGTLDSTFGTNGYLTQVMAGTNQYFSDIAELSSGKIILLGNDVASGLEEIFLYQFTNTGALDNTYGSLGHATYNPSGTNVEMYYIKKQSNDKILVGGLRFPTGTNNFTPELRRYNTDGSLDNSFGTAGSFIGPTNGTTGSIDEIIVAANDTIYFPLSDLAGSPTYAALKEAKLTPNGSLVTSWGNSGYSDSVHDAKYFLHPVLMADGKLMLGTVTGGTLPTLHINTYKFNTDGHRDASYGSNGHGWFSFSGFDQNTNWYTIENNNGILFEFDQASTTSSGARDAVMIQTDVNGNQDMSFGMAGATRTNIGTAQLNGWSYKQADGKIVLAANDASTKGVILRFSQYVNSVTNVLSEFPIYNVYPNPTGSIVSFESPIGCNYSVSNSAGTTLLQGRTITELTTLNVGQLSSGFYYLKCSKGDFQFSKKIEKL